MFDYIDYEKQAQESALHSEIIASDARTAMAKAGICPFTGRERAEIGQKPRGFDPVEMPDFDSESLQSHAIGEDTREALHLMRLCGRGVSRSSAEIWEGDDWAQKKSKVKKGGQIPPFFRAYRLTV